MFFCVLKYEDIECMEIFYKNGILDLVYFFYKDKIDEGLDNIY